MSTPIHTELARRLVKIFPKLVNGLYLNVKYNELNVYCMYALNADIYLDDEYYGEGALHMAVVNEDLSLVKYLLNNGADVKARAIGKFFCADDQKESREEVLEHEWYQMKTETNYMGFAYHLLLSYKQSVN